MGIKRKIIWITYMVARLLLSDSLTRTLMQKLARIDGVKIGKECIIASLNFGSEAYLIEMGDHVHLTEGVRLYTHDGGAWIFRQKHPELALVGRIKIGNNVFVGNYAAILPGVTIGNNCVIGAHSIVTKSIPDNSIVAGNPAKYVCSVDEYYQKIDKLQPHTHTKAGLYSKAEILALSSDNMINKCYLRVDNEVNQ